MPAYLEIHSCSECKYLNAPRHYTADSFEMVFKWECKHPATLMGSVGPRHIGYQEYPDPDPSIPKWCPLMKKE